MILATGSRPSRNRRRSGPGRAPECGRPETRLRSSAPPGGARLAQARWRNKPQSAHAFTLIELILVMALLMIVLAVSAPSLQGFFRGRNLDSEARRIYSLTSYAQSRAVYEGIPMLVWFDLRERTYGLQAASSYLPDDPKAVHFSLDRDLTMEIRSAQINPGIMLTPFVDREIGTLPTIRFRPDGSVAETSPQAIVLLQGPADAVAIGLNTNNIRYEILAHNPYATRR